MAAREGDSELFDKQLAAARMSVMGPLSAACMQTGMPPLSPPAWYQTLYSQSLVDAQSDGCDEHRGMHSLTSPPSLLI